MTAEASLLQFPFPPRPAQIEVARMMDEHLSGDGAHLAVEAPTGVGKSLLAFAAAGVNDGGVTIATYSNALMIQLRDDLEKFGDEAGLDWACLAGARHYWCELAAPYDQLPRAARTAVDELDGNFIGCGLRPFDYIKYSKASLPETDGGGSPCTGCRFRPTCSLWKARERAAEAQVVVTNGALLAIALKLRSTGETSLDGADVGAEYSEDELPPEQDAEPWPVLLLRDTIVVDEADSVESLMRDILIPSMSITAGKKGVTIEDAQLAATTVSAAMLVTRRYAEDSRHSMSDSARRFLLMLQNKDGVEREPEYQVEEIMRQGQPLPKVILQLPNRLDRWWEGLRVLAMSATLTAQQVRWLGLQPTISVQTVQGLDVSGVEVVARQAHPAWSYKPGYQRDLWIRATARVLMQRREQGNTLGLFQSRKDLNDVAEFLMSLSIPYLIYLSDQDRPTIIREFRKAGNAKILMACNAGGGRGLDLPGDLLNHVVISRVAQNPSSSIRSKLGRLRWKAASSADVIQSVGRSCRYDGDTGTVDILSGFGSRFDIRERLEERGWRIQYDRTPSPDEPF